MKERRMCPCETTRAIADALPILPVKVSSQFSSFPTSHHVAATHIFNENHKDILQFCRSKGSGTTASIIIDTALSNKIMSCQNRRAIRDILNSYLADHCFVSSSHGQNSILWFSRLLFKWLFCVLHMGLRDSVQDSLRTRLLCGIIKSLPFGLKHSSYIVVHSGLL